MPIQPDLPSLCAMPVWIRTPSFDANARRASSPIPIPALPDATGLSRSLRNENNWRCLSPASRASGQPTANARVSSGAKCAMQAESFHDRAVAQVGLCVFRTIRSINATHRDDTGCFEPFVAGSRELDATGQTVAADCRNQRRTRLTAPSVENQLGGRHGEIQKELRMICEKASRRWIKLQQ
jgi:hypothetical protein